MQCTICHQPIDEPDRDICPVCEKDVEQFIRQEDLIWARLLN
jgi:hypothetical protein